MTEGQDSRGQMLQREKREEENRCINSKVSKKNPEAGDCSINKPTVAEV